MITSKIDGDIERIASGSPRRIQQLQGRFPNIEWLELRGNVETRLRKIAELEEADGTVLAAAGLNRLEISQYPGLNFELMEFDQMVPAPGQGAIAIQSKISDAEKYSVLGCPDTERAVRLERGLEKNGWRMSNRTRGSSFRICFISSTKKLEFYVRNLTTL